MRVESYRFADRYQPRELVENPQKAREFVDEYLAHEARYFALARDPVSGLTYDGLELDPISGEPTDVRFWSAPSKECLDLGILVKSLGGHPDAHKVVGREKAVEILSQKMDSYERFHKLQPGFGGFLPWFYGGTDLHPTPDWKSHIPGLDNGEWVWTMLVAEKALRDAGYTQEAERYASYNRMLADNAVKIFFDREAGKVRGDVKVVDPWRADTRYETLRASEITPLGPGADYLTGEHGVHEGVMLVMYVSLFGKDLSEQEVQRIWDGIQMRRLEHPAGTTWEAFWGSAHESWAYLFLPFREMDEFRDLFRIRETIRAHNAVQRGYPGFATSANEPGRDGYLDGAGIEGIGSQPIRNNHTFAIYGAFPALLEYHQQPGPALVWLHNMLRAPQMQGPIGGGEAATNDGRLVSHMKTVDGSFPNVLALLGGLEKETGEMLRERGLDQRFRTIMQGEYREAFGDEPLREPAVFALPTVEVPPDARPPYEPDWNIA